MSKKKSKKNTFLGIINDLSKSTFVENDGVISFDEDFDDCVDEDFENWIQLQLSKAMTVDEFNEEFNSLSWSLEISEGSFTEHTLNFFKEYKGTVLILRHSCREGVEAIVEYSIKNPVIGREIFEAIAYW